MCQKIQSSPLFLRRVFLIDLAARTFFMSDVIDVLLA